MNAPTRVFIQVSASTFLLGLISASAASAGWGDPMSRDIEFKESLGRQDDLGKSSESQSTLRLLSKRGGQLRRNRASK